MKQEKDILLRLSDLWVSYHTEEGKVYAVNGTSFNVYKGESLGLVGETGAGKTTIALSILGLIPDPPGVVDSGKILFEGENLLEKDENIMRRIRGEKISMVFQDPMTALNPVHKIGEQIAEAMLEHSDLNREQAKEKTIETLKLVGISADRYNDYPHQFSGGMRQRVVIAIALACNPELIIADEPTTALDVTIQAQILDMMRSLKEELNTSLLLITHDLGIVAEMCDRVAVIYAGEIVELGSARQIFKETSHPYTIGLLGSLPEMDPVVKNIFDRRLKPIPGLMPDPTNLPAGCKFYPRCPFKTDLCQAKIPLTEIGEGHLTRCIKNREEIKCY